MPERVVTYLNEKKVCSIQHAAVLVDEYVLTHRTSFVPTRGPLQKANCSSVNAPSNTQVRRSRGEKPCFYCLKPCHLIADCEALKRRQQSAIVREPKGVGLVKKVASPAGSKPFRAVELDECFKPFVPLVL